MRLKGGVGWGLRRAVARSARAPLSAVARTSILAGAVEFRTEARPVARTGAPMAESEEPSESLPRTVR